MVSNLFDRLDRGRPPAKEKVKVDPAQKLLDWLMQPGTKTPSADGISLTTAPDPSGTEAKQSKQPKP